jgi:hypothetical protein
VYLDTSQKSNYKVKLQQLSSGTPAFAALFYRRAWRVKRNLDETLPGRPVAYDLENSPGEVVK